MALSGHNEMSARLSAFGVKRTCIVVQFRTPRSRLTQSGHERAAFAAMHGRDPLYSARSSGLGSSR
jgi:hypothetical protein